MWRMQRRNHITLHKSETSQKKKATQCLLLELKRKNGNSYFLPLFLLFSIWASFLGNLLKKFLLGKYFSLFLFVSSFFFFTYKIFVMVKPSPCLSFAFYKLIVGAQRQRVPCPRPMYCLNTFFFSFSALWKAVLLPSMSPVPLSTA